MLVFSENEEVHVAGIQASAVALLVVGVIAAIGPNIFMAIVTSSNTTGWNTGVASMYNNVQPIVVIAGFILIILGSAFLRGGRKGI